VGSRPPVYFAEYDCGLAVLPEAAETRTSQRYLLNYTPDITQFQRRALMQAVSREAISCESDRLLLMCDLRAFA
jgi:hypothetical protein